MHTLHVSYYYYFNVYLHLRTALASITVIPRMIYGIAVCVRVCLLYMKTTFRDKATTKGCGLIKIDELKWNCFRGAVISTCTANYCFADEITRVCGQIVYIYNTQIGRRDVCILS